MKTLCAWFSATMLGIGGASSAAATVTYTVSVQVAVGYYPEALAFSVPDYISTATSIAPASLTSCLPGGAYYNGNAAGTCTGVMITPSASPNATTIEVVASGSPGFTINLASAGMLLANGSYSVTPPHNAQSATLSISGSPSPLPEPASWAMMLVGFGSIAVGLRRQRTAVSFR